MRKVLRFVKYLISRVLIVGFVSLLLIVLLQDLLILPYLRESLVHRYLGRGKTATDLGPEVSQIFVKNSLGRGIEVWRYSPPEGKAAAGRAAIIFRGNGGSLHNYLTIPQSLAKLGYSSYLINYPGMGDSKGYPSEEKINQDAAQVRRYITEKDGADPAKMIILGYSFGTGPASWLASLHEPAAVVLLAPFPKLASVIERIPLYGYLTPFLFYRMNEAENIAELKNSCLIVATADNDQLIPNDLSSAVADAYTGAGGIWRFSSAQASHDSIYSSNETAILGALQSCLAKVRQTAAAGEGR